MYTQNNIEKVCANVLNDDFIKIFKPTFLMQRILGLLRVNVEYRYATSPTLAYNIYSIALWFVNTICLIDYILNNSCENSFDSKYIDSALKLGSILNGVNGLLLICRNNMHRRDDICQFYIKMQKIERYLHIRDTKSKNHSLYTFTVVILSTVCILQTIFFSIFNVFFLKKMCPASLIILFTSMSTFVELIQIYVIIQFITIRLEYINSSLRQTTPDLNMPYVDHRKVFSLLTISESTNDIPSFEVVRGFYCILDSLSDFRKHYQFSVSAN